MFNKPRSQFNKEKELIPISDNGFELTLRHIITITIYINCEMLELQNQRKSYYSAI